MKSRKLSCIALLALFATAANTWGQCEVGQLQAPDGLSGDVFGGDIAMSGNLAVIGARAENGWGGDGFGQAYIWRFNGSSWILEQKLEPSDARQNDEFGGVLATDGNTVMIGSGLHDHNSKGAAGAVWVYRFDPDVSAWVEVQELRADDGAPGDLFQVPAIDNDIAVIGAITDDDGRGSAYVFRFDGSSWIQEQKLMADDGLQGDHFGRATAILGDVIMIAAFDNNETGSVYVFRFDPDICAWVQSQKLVAGDPAEGEQFGKALSLDGHTALIGARKDDEQGAEAGAAYVFSYRPNIAQWVQVQKLLPEDLEPGDHFGVSVDLSDDFAIVGSFLDDDNGGSSGSAYVYRFDPSLSLWIEQSKVTPSDGSSGDRFGTWVATSFGTAIIGAYLDDTEKGGNNAGSAYVFELAGNPADLNGDGVVSTIDLLILLANWGSNCNF